MYHQWQIKLTNVTKLSDVSNAIWLLMQVHLSRFSMFRFLMGKKKSKILIKNFFITVKATGPKTKLKACKCFSY